MAGWTGVVAIVLVADYLGDQTMSELFRAVARHPVGRPVLIGVWATLTAHLFGLIPAQYDPLELTFGFVRRHHDTAT